MDTNRILAAIQMIQENMSSSEARVLERFDGLEARLVVVESGLIEVGEKLEELSEKFQKQENNLEKCGQNYEIMVRRELRDLRGQAYARSFKIRDLHGLARLALPKDVDFQSAKLEYLSEGYISVSHQDRVNTLTLRAEEQIPVLERWLEKHMAVVAELKGRKKKKTEEKSLVQKWSNVDAAMRKYNASNNEEKKSMLSNTLLGIWAFSTFAFDSTSDEFVFDLECDVRGATMLKGNKLDIEIGEVKGGKGRDLAMRQLLKRLAITGTASRLLLDEYAARRKTADSSGYEEIEIYLHGALFTTYADWSRPTCKEIESMVANLHLKPLSKVSMEVNVL